MNLRCLFIYYTLLYSLSVLAESPYNKFPDCPIIPKDGRLESVFANFTQHKSLEGLKKPLESKGTLEIVVGKVLKWKTLEPIEEEIIIDKEALVILDDAQNEIRRLEDAKIKYLAMLLLNLNSKTAEESPAIQESFKIICTKLESPNYQLEIEVLDNEISQFISKISIRGSLQAESIEIIDQTDHLTNIKLSQMRTN